MDLFEKNVLYHDAISQLEEAANVMNLDPNILDRLRRPKRALVVSVPIRLDDGTVKTFSGYRVQHNMTYVPAVGFVFIQCGSCGNSCLGHADDI